MPKGGKLKIISKILEGVPHQLAHLIEKTSTNDDKNKMIDIMIMDTGIGINENDLAKVFSPFYSKNKEDSGTGLGLYISYQIIRELGGAIYAEKGEEGLGTIIHVQIPLHNQDLSGSLKDG